jgi:hypothetical protein
MKNCTIMVVGFLALFLCLISCSDKSAGGDPVELDMTVVGKWQGAIGKINLSFPPLVDIQFKGAEIFANIYKKDSSFTLITLDTSRTALPVIKDTTMVMTGTWRLNAIKDTIQLLSDTCVVVDTSLNVLSPRQVRGRIIPIPVKIDKQNGTILWHVDIIDLAPVAPLIGLNIPNIQPDMIVISLEKMSQ